MKKIIIVKTFLILVFVTAMTFAVPVVCLAEEYVETKTNETPDIEEPKHHHIPWLFVVYDNPSFNANIIESYQPQTILLLETNDDGWGLKIGRAHV